MAPIVGVFIDTICSNTETSSRLSILAPPPRTNAITSKFPLSRDCNVLINSFAFEKLARYSMKSMADLAALIPASKSLIVIELVANSNATRGRWSVKSNCSRTESTFLKPTDDFFCLSSILLISSSSMACSWTISIRLTFKIICICPLLLTFLPSTPPTLTRLPFFKFSRCC